MTGYLVAALVMIGLVAVYRLLTWITARGGTSRRDATEIANQVLAEADIFRGSRSADDPEWDGQNRLARPISEGLPLWPVAPPHRDGD
jgi:hypothetical protein